MSITSEMRPRVWRLARIDFDRVRQRPVLLYPEGAMFINETGKAILELCDGKRTVAEIAAILGQRYQSDVAGDVAEYLDLMADHSLVHLT